jgi:methenyltetrahydrofolate cyclohydrolase
VPDAGPDQARRPLSELLDDVAAQTPAPGGGSSAAWASALAAALVEMAAGFTLAREEYAPLHERMSATRSRAAELRARALRLADDELRAYEPVLAALGLPRDDPAREHRVATSLSRAADSPLEIARVAAEVAELAAEVATTGNRSLEGDAVAGAFLADAACRAAGRLVEINLRSTPDDPRVTEAEQLSATAVGARERARPPSAH